MTRLKSLLIAWLILLFAPIAQATTITIVRPETSSPEMGEALFRLQGELLALGLDVHVVPRAEPGAAPRSDKREWVRQFAAERRSDAVIELIGDAKPAAVDVWIVDSAREPRVSRVVLDADTANAPETLAIRAIEVLRSSFLEIDLAARRRSETPVDAPRAVASAKDDASPAKPAAGERLGVEAGALVITGVDGVGPALMPVVRLDWALGSVLAAQATFAGFGTRPTLETELGSAQVSQHFALLSLCYCTPFEAGLRPVLSLAAGALRTALEGRAEAPERGHSVARWSFLTEASLGARLGLPGGYDLTLASHVHWAEPYVAIRFVDAEVGSTGRPNLLMSLTLGAWL